MSVEQQQVIQNMSAYAGQRKSMNIWENSQDQWDSRDEITQEMRAFSEDETVIYDEKLHWD